MTIPNFPHSFRSPDLLDLALTHSSCGASRDNERLEFLGDAALDLVVAEELFRFHRDLAEGDLTELKASVVSRKTLAEAATALELGSAARLGQGLRQRALPRSVLANLYEAVLGAVYLDGGLEAARAFAVATLSTPLGAVRARARTAPSGVIESRGEAHAKAFLVAAEADDERFPSAWGRTLKEAESWAAHEALLVLADRGLV